MNPLTPKEQQTLTAIQTFISDNGYPPSVRDLCQVLGVKSPSTVQSRLADLTFKGYLKRVAGQARTMRVIRP